jgi:hypothetical protein
MALAQELPVYKASYELIIGIFGLVKNFNREYKYSIGESLKKEAIDMVTVIYRANMHTEKTEFIKRAREHLEVTRLHIRLLKDLKQIPLNRFVNVNIHIENISKQLTGWQRACAKKEGKEKGV